MIFTYKNSFLENYHDRAEKNIKLCYAKVGETVPEDFQDSSDESLFNISEPTLGFYEFSGILGTDNTLQISLEPKYSDLSVERYKYILLVYEDTETTEKGVMSMITLESGETLRRTVNMIDIPGFSPQCSVTLSRTSDIDRLEGAGQGRYKNIWSKDEQDSYITLESWKSKNQDFRCTDTGLDHLDTVYINKYGFKIY